LHATRPPLSQASAARLHLFAKGAAQLGNEDASSAVQRHVLRTVAPEAVDLLLQYEVSSLASPLLCGHPILGCPTVFIYLLTPYSAVSSSPLNCIEPNA
jgi:hypothetical protein